MRLVAIVSSTLVLALLGCGGDEEPKHHERSLADVPAQQPKVVITGKKAPKPSGTDAVDLSDPDAPANLESADRVLTADLHGTGTPLVFAAAKNEVHWGPWIEGASSPMFQGRHVGKGMLQTWMAKDLDGDGKEEVVMAFGMGRDFANADAQIVLLRSAQGGSLGRQIWKFKGPRTQITALQPWPRADGTFDIYVAAFEDRFAVRGGVLPRDGGVPAWIEGHTVRMGMYRAVGDYDGDGTVETAIGRLYGDETGQDGDLRVVKHDGTTTMITTLRGVRAVGSGDVDGDGRPELLFGDGWHKNYGKIARYRPTVARWANGWTTELVTESAEQYAVEQIGVVGNRLVAGGNLFVTAYERGDAGWSAVGTPARTATTGTFAPGPSTGLIVGGTIPKLAPLP